MEHMICEGVCAYPDHCQCECGKRQAATREARRIVAINTAGFDSTRGQIALDAVCEIDDALTTLAACPVVQERDEGDEPTKLREAFDDLYFAATRVLTKGREALPELETAHIRASAARTALDLAAAARGATGDKT